MALGSVCSPGSTALRWRWCRVQALSSEVRLCVLAALGALQVSELQDVGTQLEAPQKKTQKCTYVDLVAPVRDQIHQGPLMWALHAQSRRTSMDARRRNSTGKRHGLGLGLFTGFYCIAVVSCTGAVFGSALMRLGCFGCVITTQVSELQDVGTQRRRRRSRGGGAPAAGRCCPANAIKGHGSLAKKIQQQKRRKKDVEISRRTRADNPSRPASHDGR
jgi:hypothetical protein